MSPAEARHVLFFFVDGLGLGADEPATNPVARARTPAFERLLGGRKLCGRERVENDVATMVPADATLGVPGLPQSATGQTALLTGLNSAAEIGRHLTAYPNERLRGVLAEHSLFRRLVAAGRSVAFANAFTPAYFQMIGSGRRPHAAFTYSAIAAGVRLRNLDDLTLGTAVYMDLVNAVPREAGHDVPLITPREAGANLAGIAAAHEFTAYEYFLTDFAAHGRLAVDPVEILELVDEAFGAAVDASDLADTLVVLASDHGNIEDGETRSHTTNPVPVLLAGAGHAAVADRIRSITDVAPAILGALGVT